MAVAALVISIVAVVFTGASLWYTHLANERAKRAEERARRAESRDAARFAGEQAETELAALERIGKIMRLELAAAVEASATEPQAPRRVKAAQSRLEQAIAAIGIDLPASAEYARTADAALLPEAERELGQAIATIQPWHQF